MEHLLFCNLLVRAECQLSRDQLLSVLVKFVMHRGIVERCSEGLDKLSNEANKTAITVTGTMLIKAQFIEMTLDVSVKCLVRVLHNVTM